MKLYVYGLYDLSDQTEKVFYVGITSNLRQRHLNHCGHAKRAVGKWVKELRAKKSDCGMKLLEITDEKQGAAREAEWIINLRPALNYQVPSCPTESASDIHLATFTGTLAEIERAVIVQVLQTCHGNKRLAAETLGIGRQTLYNKIALHKIEFRG